MLYQTIVYGRGRMFGKIIDTLFDSRQFETVAAENRYLIFKTIVTFVNLNII